MEQLFILIIEIYLVFSYITVLYTFHLMNLPKHLGIFAFTSFLYILSPITLLVFAVVGYSVKKDT